MQNEIPKILADALADHDAKRALIVELQHSAKDAFEIVEQFQGTHHGYIGATVAPCNYASWISGHFSSLGEVAEIRRLIAARGWRMSDTTDFPQDRYFTVEHRKEGVAGRLILSCHMSLSEGATCRYVQTGEKTVPVYELKCEPAGAAS